MRIGVVSDTHGSKSAMRRVIEKAGIVDLWLHGGDYSYDAEFIRKVTGLPVWVVAGNCDGRSKEEPYEFIELDNHLIWLTHGHRDRVKHWGSEALLVPARSYGADIVVYGHTHRPDILRSNGIVIVNPGSPSEPRSEPRGTFAVIDIQGAEVEATLIGLD